MSEAKKCKCDNHNSRLLSLDAVIGYFLLVNEGLKDLKKKLEPQINVSSIQYLTNISLYSMCEVIRIVRPAAVSLCCYILKY